MTTPLAAPVWRSVRRSRSGSNVTRHLVDHAVRGDHTLCGIKVTELGWTEPAGLRRCSACSAVPDGHAVWGDLVSPTLTYRRLDYWSREGYLKVVNSDPGSGQRRYWSAEEAHVAVTMASLVDAGLTVPAAHRAARNGGWLAEGVRVVVSSDQDDHSG